ncbi:MAG: glycosyltransferase [Verrucomicrobiota bacterium]
MTVSVMITTRDRADDLAVTLHELSRLAPACDELLVTLDGCRDRSLELLQTGFPEARVIVNPVSRGSIPSRDRMIREAAGDLVLSLDDDSHPVEPDFIARAARLFADDPRLAVLCFPQRSEEFPASLSQASFGPDMCVASYASSGVLLRRSTYLSLPGYATGFGHVYEEPDYALQCIAAGWGVRLHTGLLIRHRYSSVNRNEIRTHHLHARNECWSALLRCPWPVLPFALLRRAAGQFAYACRRGPRWVVREPQWWWRAAAGFPTVWRDRAPVGRREYSLWRGLLRNPRPADRP